MSRTLKGMAALGLLSSGFASSVVQAELNQAGINVDYLYDSDNTPMLADLMRTYRYVNTSNAAYSANDAPLDASGWATTDAWYFLGDANAIKHGDGTYALKFTGQATVTAGKGGAQGSVLNQAYDASTNTTTALIQTKTGTDLTDVRFLNTKRTADSATNTGVTNVQIMRPTTPGGSTPYSFDTTFTGQTVAIASKVSTLRFMDYLATNGNVQTNWADRTLPTAVKLNPTLAGNSRGRGGPLELAVQLGNESNRDIWLNVPALASDDYVTKMAQLIKYGSDGVNPYTSPQKNPVYKPLNPNLHVYLEYSNETWNTSFGQFTQIKNLALAEVAKEAGTVGPLNYAPTDNVYYLTERYNALRTKQIADTFSGVFGQGAMLSTVRPILAWQYGNGNDTANQAVTVLDGYFNNEKGNFVSKPTPINSYIYGGGSANYYAPTSAVAALTVDKILTEPAAQSAAFTAKVTKDIAYTTTFGIKRVAYEGGLSLDPGGTAETADSLAAKYAALADPRMTQLTINVHNTWSNQGGDLLVYYFSTDQYKFGFTNDTFDTNTPKLNALATLSATDRTTAYSIGVPISGSAPTQLRGGKFDLKDTYGSASDAALGLVGGAWSSYLINLPQAGTYSVVAHFKTYGTAASFQLLLGGGVIGDFDNLLSNTAYTGTQGVVLTLPAGITSIRMLMDATSGGLSLNDITFTPLSVVTIPEPAGLAAAGVAGVAALRRRRR